MHVANLVPIFDGKNTAHRVFLPGGFGVSESPAKKQRIMGSVTSPANSSNYNR